MKWLKKVLNTVKRWMHAPRCGMCGKKIKEEKPKIQYKRVCQDHYSNVPETMEGGIIVSSNGRSIFYETHAVAACADDMSENLPEIEHKELSKRIIIPPIGEDMSGRIPRELLREMESKLPEALKGFEDKVIDLSVLKPDELEKLRRRDDIIIFTDGLSNDEDPIIGNGGLYL